MADLTIHDDVSHLKIYEIINKYFTPALFFRWNMYADR